MPPTHAISDPVAREKKVYIAFSLLRHAYRIVIASAAVGIMLFLLPFSVPGERLLLLLCLAGFWIGLIAAVWKYPVLRLSAFLVAAIQFFPIRTGTTRLLLLLGLAALWLSAAFVFRKSRIALIALLVAPALVGGILLLPGRPVDRAALRAEYLRSLMPYQGVVYIWGGENRLGMDCSGLIRCGWIDACLRCGLHTVNPALVRTAVQTWQQDCSAKELGEGYRGRTVPVLSTPSLNTLDYRRLLPGDIAVTESGQHILAYLGDKTWIEADPLPGRLGILTANVTNSVWLETGMKIVRWRVLQEPPGNVVYYSL